MGDSEVTNTDMVVSARRALWDPDEIGEPEISGLLGRLSAKDIDTGDLYFQLARHESWSLEDGKVKNGVFTADRGVGVRAISGEKTGFAYADNIALPALREATEAARSIARTGYGSGSGVLTGTTATVRYADVDPIASAREDAKVALLRPHRCVRPGARSAGQRGRGPGFVGLRDQSRRDHGRFDERRQTANGQVRRHGPCGAERATRAGRERWRRQVRHRLAVRHGCGGTTCPRKPCEWRS